MNTDSTPQERQEKKPEQKEKKKEIKNDEKDKKLKSSDINYDSEESVHAALVELGIYLCFLILTLIVAASSRSMYMYFFNKSIENVFTTYVVNKTSATTVSFNDLATTADFFNFLELKFLDNLHGSSQQASGGGGAGRRRSTAAREGAPRHRRDAGDNLIFLDQNLVLGPPRLRQLRVKEGSCDVADVFGKYFTKCYAAYSSDVEETEAEFQGLKYQTLSELEANSIWGEIDTYYGGGYVKDLTYDEAQNKAILQELKDKKWLDRGTRLIVIEFNLYNANMALFNCIKFIVETPPIGGVVVSYFVQSLKYASIFYHGSYVTLAFAVIFYLFVLYYLVQEVKQFIVIGWQNYFLLIWNLVDVTIIVLAILSLVYNIWHPLYMSTILNRIRDSPDKFVPLDTICYWNMIYQDLIAICAFLVCIKIFKFISFNKSMRQFSTTLKRCAHDLLGFSVMFGIVFLAYAQLGLLLFGSVHYDFRNFHESVLTMIRMILGDFDYDGIENANRVLGPIYFLTYILLVFFILLNMFLAIINDTYSTVKGEVQSGRNYLSDYMRKLCDKICLKLCKRKPRDVKKDDAERGERRKPKDDDASGSPQGEAHKDILDEVSPGQDTSRIARLTVRVAVLEDMIQQLLADMDRTLQRVRPRPSYRRINRRPQQSTSA